jgi:hypothetical protein
MTTRFSSAATIELQANGHGAIGFKSKCTDGHILTYLEARKVPSGNVVCQSEEPNPFLSDKNPLYTDA